MLVRPPAVAGVFYPADAAALHSEVSRLLGAVSAPAETVAPKAVIVPHAALRYSGAVAASAYARVAALRGQVRTVVLLGPAHYAPAAIALSGADAFATPLGSVPVDAETTARMRALPCAQVRDGVHTPEHCLEVQLPFLQVVLGDVAIVPVLAGAAADVAVADVLEAAWDGPATLVVVTSDLSHYLTYEQCRVRDAATAASIEALAADAIPQRAACGREGIQGLLRVAARRGLVARTVDLHNSGDAGGDRKCVVGYGAFIVGLP